MFCKDTVPASNILPRRTSGSLQIAPSVSAGFEMWRLGPAAGISIGSWSSASSSWRESNRREKKKRRLQMCSACRYRDALCQVSFSNALLIKAAVIPNKTKRNSICKDKLVNQMSWREPVSFIETNKPCGSSFTYITALAAKAFFIFTLSGTCNSETSLFVSSTLTKMPEMLFFNDSELTAVVTPVFSQSLVLIN